MPMPFHAERAHENHLTGSCIACGHLTLNKASSWAVICEGEKVTQSPHAHTESRPPSSGSGCTTGITITTTTTITTFIAPRTRKQRCIYRWQTY
ncbi:hypothetical protein E2C01_075351 [Portunus trituberculatus]|uniref:Uncharacterized protein n=1 Tax=Portunus trituberculatus TaxID=210409 RepID=A0A5B7I8B1_PORTR|nr:hypothetical protein [Portunus trituberculatus]